jgi:hypothetical protein
MERSIRQLSQARNAGEEEENCAAETHWSTPQKGSWKGMALRRKNSNTLRECQEWNIPLAPPFSFQEKGSGDEFAEQARWSCHLPSMARAGRTGVKTPSWFGA